MIDTPFPVTVTLGVPFTLSCTSRGSPPDTFTWRRSDGQAVPSINVNAVIHTNTSAVFCAEYMDTITTSGIYTYTCTVTNLIGSDSETITVTTGKYCFVLYQDTWYCIMRPRSWPHCEYIFREKNAIFIYM